jgi:hypothetical protein
MVGAIGGATGAWGGGVAVDPVAFISPCDRFCAPAAAGCPVIIPWANDCPSWFGESPLKPVAGESPTPLASGELTVGAP